MGKFVIEYKDARFCFRLKAMNGETIASGKAYINKRACIKAIESISKNIKNAGYLSFVPGDDPAHTVSNPKFEMSLDNNGFYTFVLKARNGEIILTSGTYKSKQGCLNGIESVRKNACEYEIIEHL